MQASVVGVNGLSCPTTCGIFPDQEDSFLGTGTWFLTTGPPKKSRILFFKVFLFLLFKKIIYFNWRLITLQYCGGFCHTFTRVSHRCTCVPHPEPPSHLPPHPISQGHSSTPVLSTLSHASNLDWRSISHIIIYMF